MDKKFVEIAKCDAWAEADILRGRLAAQGISAVLLGPNTSSTLGMYMGAASKVSVLVPKGSARRAEKILLEETPARGARTEKGVRSSAPHTPIRLPSRRVKKTRSKK